MSEIQSTACRIDEPPQNPDKGYRFWMVFVVICVATFLSALEFTAVSTALPTIAHDLHGDSDYIWVASAYALASSALLPASGGMAEVFGRRVTMLLSLSLFALGSALCGSAKNMTWLIAARTVQGAGGGGIQSLGGIILSDLVPLRERGLYNSMVGMTWAVAGGIGPLVGGLLANSGQWRWLFYLNLPISGVAAALVLMFLNLRTPPGNLKDKLIRMDWIGIIIIVASSSAVVLGLTWGGVRFLWVSSEVLTPLILGLLGMCGFLVYETVLAKDPVVPFTLLSNRTSLSGFLQTFLAPVINVSVIYYLTVYYQACKGASPARAGILSFSFCIPAGAALLLSGASIQITKSYRAQHWLGWVLFLVAMGTMSTLQASSPLSQSIGFPILAGLGVGLVYAANYFPVLAPLPVSENAHALAFLAFCRSFAGVWGVTIGTAVLQTQLSQHLPSDFITQFPKGIDIAYTSIPVIGSLEEPLQSKVREAFAQSLSVIWKVNVGIAGMGFLSSLAMKALPLHTGVDKKWGLEDGGTSGNLETPQAVKLKEQSSQISV